MIDNTAVKLKMKEALCNSEGSWISIIKAAIDTGLIGDDADSNRKIVEMERYIIKARHTDGLPTVTIA